jgi:hypothetical protein
MGLVSGASRPMKYRLLTGLAMIVVWYVGISLLAYFQTFYFPRGFWIDGALAPGISGVWSIAIFRWWQHLSRS